MSKSKKVYITKRNTIFNPKVGFANIWGTNDLKWDDIKRLSKFYYDGFKLHKIKEIKKDLKQTQAYLIIVTPDGEFKEVLQYWENAYETVFRIKYAKSPPGLYETGEDFLKDLSNYKQERITTLNNAKERYQKSLQRYNKEMKQLEDVLSSVEDYPEEFI
jgi:hypothetical protein